MHDVHEKKVAPWFNGFASYLHHRRLSEAHPLTLTLNLAPFAWVFDHRRLAEAPLTPSLFTKQI